MADDLEPAEPPDRDDVFSAARLGWSIAELRGRVREAASGVRGEPLRPIGVLPVGQERSQTEQLIEYVAVIQELAVKLGVDVPLRELSRAPRGMRGTASDWLRRDTWAVANPKEADPQAPTTAAPELSPVYYSWDAKIQDILAAKPSVSAAYQLGRGVAEIRWGFDSRTSEPGDLKSGAFLLGVDRGGRLDRLIDRLSGYYDSITRHALQASLAAWRVHDPDDAAMRDDAWRVALARQATIWHDLILGQRTGASLVSPKDFLDEPVSLLRIISKLRYEAVLIGVGAGLLVLAAALLTQPGIEERLSVISAAVGALGLTFGSISAKARSSANDLIGALRRDLYRSLVVGKAVILPSTTGQGAGR